MKDSGVEWIGEIPEGWEIRKIFWLFGLIGSGTTPIADNEEYFDGDIPWLNTGDLTDGLINSCNKYISSSALKKYSALKIYPSSVLSNTDTVKQI
ncbi:hypothetical protein FACS1894190_15530 [Spirochaetia bacterium]|nr:hypothetical protein FACS1894190_15530 [Spirochaetia bacterium]